MITLRRFTGFAYGHDNPEPALYINPANIAYLEPRVITRGGAEEIDGTRIYFQQEAGVLDVRESVPEVVDALTGASWRRCVEADPERYGIRS